MTNVIKSIERVYPWVLLSPALLPVVLWGGLIYPYLVPKTLLFYAISFIAAGMFAILATHRSAFFWSRLRRFEAWIPAALLVLAYVASAFGEDFYKSFWSLFIRGDGLLMLTCAVTSFYLILLYADRKFFERLLRATASVASLVAVYGIVEWMLGDDRIGSLLGNAAFFAGYLGIAFFATLLAAQTLSRFWRRAAHFGASLQIIAIILSATRGTILAFVIACGVALAYTACFGKERLRVWSAGILTALIILSGLFFAFRAELSLVSFNPVARIASISLSDETVNSRLFIWKNMVTEIQKSPWLGVGAENIDSLFNRFYDPTQIYEQWFDRSHNAFLDYAAQYGVGGLLLYLALIGSFFTITIRLIRQRKELYEAKLFALLAITYAVQNFFVFDTVSSFWLLLALLASFIAVSSEETPREALPFAPWMRGSSWFFAAILLYLIIPMSIRPALAAYDLAHAYTYQLTDVSKEAEYISRGSALGTYGDLEYGYQVYSMYIHNQTAVLTGKALSDAYKTALTVLSANFNRYVSDGRTAIYLAHVLSLAPEGISIDDNLLSSALARAIEKSPKRSQAWYILANLSIRNANAHPTGSKEWVAGYRAAQDILTRYIDLVPALSTPHFVLAELLRALGNTQEAVAEASKGRELYVPDIETARRAVGFYESMNDWQNAQFFLKEVATLPPGDIMALYDLAKVTYLAGDPAGAADIVATLRATNPDILKTDMNFLNAITVYEQSKK